MQFIRNSTCMTNFTGRNLSDPRGMKPMHFLLTFLLLDRALSRQCKDWSRKISWSIYIFHHMAKQILGRNVLLLQMLEEHARWKMCGNYGRLDVREADLSICMFEFTNLSKVLLNKLSCFVVQIFTTMLFCKTSNTNCICGVKLTFQKYAACIDDISNL